MYVTIFFQASEGDIFIGTPAVDAVVSVRQIK